MQETLVSFKDVQKSYDGETLVVKNLNVDIARGEFLTLLGPSGSGKTTTLMMLAGFEAPTRGTIELAGQSINNLPPHRRNIGMVFQNYALFPHMTVEENLSFPLEVRRLPREEIRKLVERALGLVQLDSFGKRRPGQLSGGQQQRVALARALIFEPQLVLMDEPLGALDKQLREHMQYEIKHIHERLGVTIVYVTHDQQEALTMSNRIAVFNDGVIQQLATPADLYERPENAFVAQFIGENNRLRGTVAETGDGVCQVRLPSGDVVRATRVAVQDAGQDTTLSIRPERVSLNPEPGSFANIFHGRIEELIYIGDHIRTRLAVCGDENFIVKVPNAIGALSLQQGAAVSVGWTQEDCRALDA